VDAQKKYAGLVVPYRLTYWPPHNFIAEHYRKEKIWLKQRGRRAGRRAGPIPSVHIIGAASRQRLGRDGAIPPGDRALGERRRTSWRLRRVR
jgi:hypothetical protein